MIVHTPVSDTNWLALVEPHSRFCRKKYVEIRVECRIVLATVRTEGEPTAYTMSPFIRSKSKLFAS